MKNFKYIMFLKRWKDIKYTLFITLSLILYYYIIIYKNILKLSLSSMTKRNE